MANIMLVPSALLFPLRLAFGFGSHDFGPSPWPWKRDPFLSLQNRKRKSGIAPAALLKCHSDILPVWAIRAIWYRLCYSADLVHSGVFAGLFGGWWNLRQEGQSDTKKMKKKS